MSPTDQQRFTSGPFLWVLTLIVFAAGAAVAESVISRIATVEWRAFSMLPLLALLAGLFPARFGRLRVNITASHPFVFCAMVVAGPMGAISTNLAGLVGALIGRRKRPVPMHLIFNLGLVTLSAASASAAYAQLGGTTGGDLAGIVGPLFGASVVYFLVNSWLVSIAIALETRTRLVEVWHRSTLWTVVPFFAGVSFSLALVGVFHAFPLWIFLAALPPTVLIVSFCRKHRYGESSTS